MGLPAHINKGFTIISHESDAPTHRFSFIISTRYADRTVIGNLVGNFNDEVFNAKLRFWQGIMNVKYGRYGIYWYQSVTYLQVKESRRLDDLEKYNRAVTRATNEYVKRKEELEKLLFADEEIDKLQQDYKTRMKKIKKQYNQ